VKDPKELFQKGDGLLVIDIQKDFCPGGALPIPEGDRVVSIINAWIDGAGETKIPVYVSRDWHPLHHMSFREMGGNWPVHCVQDSDGAQFHPLLRVPETAEIISKGVRFDKDQKSVFDETGFAAQLKWDGITRLWMGGLAQDVCVLASVIEAREAGLQVSVILEGTRPTSSPKGKEALRKMEAAGATIIRDKDFVAG